MPSLYRRFVTAVTGYDRATHCINLNPRTNTFLRFLIAGGLNTLFGFAIFSAVIAVGAVAWLALLIGTVAGTLFNFFTTGGYVFRELSSARFPRFIFCYFFVYGINLVMLETLSIWISNKTLSQFILTLPIAVLSYFLMARFVFAPKKKPEDWA